MRKDLSSESYKLDASANLRCECCPDFLLFLPAYLSLGMAEGFIAICVACYVDLLRCDLIKVDI